MSDIAKRYEFALQQIAAESYLDLDGVSMDNNNPKNHDEIIKRLNNGNNRDFVEDKKGATRMTTSQTSDFLDKYEIIDHLPNTDSGFSATLIRNKTTQEFTLSFRSTEYRPEKEGGDHKHDAQGADIDIPFAGFAYAQLRDMETYYTHLKLGESLNQKTGKWEPSDRLTGFKAQFGGDHPARDALNITGYSLGGHMATVFTETHANEVKQTYTFNAVGRGDFDADKYSLQEIQAKFWEAANDPASHALKNVGDKVLTVGGDHSLMALYADALAKQQSHPVFPAGDIYQDPRYQWAKEWTKATYGITHTASPGKTNLAPEADLKIVQSSGLATHGDTKIVADSDSRSSNATDFFIEDQPNLEGSGGRIPQLTNPLAIVGDGDFGRTHSIVLLVDSLALMKTLEPMGNLDSAQLGAIFAASSNERASIWTVNRQADHAAESSSLENTLDSMRKLLDVKAKGKDGETISYGGKGWETPPDLKVGGFGNIGNREIFYEHLADLQKVIAAHPNLKLQPLVDIDQFATNGEPKRNAAPYPAANMAAHANENTDEGLAWRYSLKEQIPFVLTGDASIYAVHNKEGELNLHDATGKGMTPQSINEQAIHLERKVYLNVHDLPEKEDTAPADMKKLLSEAITPKFNNNDLTLPGLATHAKYVDLFLADSGRPSSAIETIQQQIAMRLALQEKSGVDIPAYIYKKAEVNQEHFA